MCTSTTTNSVLIALPGPTNLCCTHCSHASTILPQTQVFYVYTYVNTLYSPKLYAPVRINRDRPNELFFSVKYIFLLLFSFHIMLNLLVYRVFMLFGVSGLLLLLLELLRQLGEWPFISIIIRAQDSKLY